MKPRYLIPALLGALLLAYPLSIGPAMLIFYRNPSFSSLQRIDDFYVPLGWVCKECEPINKSLIWYAHLWSPREKPEVR